MYIKLKEDMVLETTSYEPIYRGDNLNRRIIYLIPLTVGEIDISTACIYLCYIRADGTPDIVILERMKDKYKEAYYQYTLPVTCRLTKYPGEVCTWLQIFSGSLSKPVISKSGECTLYIQESKNMDDCICDHQLSAIYALQRQTDEASENVTTIREELEKKGDDLSYDAERQVLQLTSGGRPVGIAIDMSKMVNDDETIHFGDESEDSEDTDAVIYFG